MNIISCVYAITHSGGCNNLCVSPKGCVESAEFGTAVLQFNLPVPGGVIKDRKDFDFRYPGEYFLNGWHGVVFSLDGFI